MIANPSYYMGLHGRDAGCEGDCHCTNLPPVHAGFGEAAIRSAAKLSNCDPIPRRLSLLVRVPVSRSRDFHRRRPETARDRGRAEAFADRMVREIAMVAPLFDRDRDVVQLHLGEDALPFLQPSLLAELMESLSRQFHFTSSSARDFSIGIDPGSVEPAAIEALAGLGFNRACLELQELDPAASTVTDQAQIAEAARATIHACRQHRFRTVAVDLSCGVPGQTLAGFEHTLDIVVECLPDQVAIAAAKLKPPVPSLRAPTTEASACITTSRAELLALAVDKLTTAGYCHLGLYRFVRPGDVLNIARQAGHLHHDDLGYSIHARPDLIGLGVGALSHVGDTYTSNPCELAAWEARIDAGGLPACCSRILDADDRLRAELVEQVLCRGEIETAGLEARHGIDFVAHFRDELLRLSDLAAEGVVEVSEKRIVVTPRGRWRLDAVAACFDQRAPLSAPSAPVMRPPA